VTHRKVVLVSFALGSAPAFAANPEFQSFFFQSCVAPSDQLAFLCGVSAGGDLSGNSESSLNPNQSLSNNENALNAARTETQTPTVSVETEVGPFGLFASARMASEEFDRTFDLDLERGYESDIWGVDLGFDQRLEGGLTWGGVVSFGNIDSEFDGGQGGVNFTPVSSAGDIEADTLGFTLFAYWRASDSFYTEATVGYTSYEYELTRNAVFQESTRTVPQLNVSTRANPDGDLTTASLAAGYDWSADAWTVGLTGDLRYASAEVDSYVERDPDQTGLAMAFSDTDRDSLLGGLELAVTYALSTGAGVVLPELRAQYLHEFDRDAAEAKAAYVFDTAGTIFSMTGEDADEDYGVVGAGIVWVLQNGWIPFLEAEMLVGYDDLDRYAVSAGIRREL
jgi:uncharacterized protein YhjY with autotransporter beta-barrel domain